MKRILISCVAAGLLTACAADANKPSTETAQNTVNRMTYAKDARSGLCFGIVAGQSTLQSMGSISATNVPCDKVENLLGK